MKYFMILCASFICHMGNAALPSLTRVNKFHYDGCTMFVEGTASEPKLWDHCCLEHDLFYWAGGSKIQRRNADRALRQCIRDVGHPRLAQLMYVAVRTGRFYPFPFVGQQWGNAWASKRNYRCLSAQDVENIYVDLDDYDLDLAMKDRLILSLQTALGAECGH